MAMHTCASAIGMFNYVKAPGKQAVMFAQGFSTPPETIDFDRITDLPPRFQLALSCSFVPNLKLVKQLVANGTVDVNEDRTPGADLTALEFAARKGHSDIVRWLVTSGGANVNNGSPIAWACYTDQLEIAKWLVSQGGDPHKTDR